MNVSDFVKILDADFFSGVPDSQLKALCDYLMNTYGIDGKHHIIAANEGNAVGIAAGYHLATGRIPVVYMQNSGEGNIINPLASLLSEKVYGIPCIFVIGWRGEPGIKDEPQHVFQGEITCRLLTDMGVQYFIITPETTVDELKAQMREYHSLLDVGKSVAFVIRKGALGYEQAVSYENDHCINREEALRHIIRVAGNDVIISTTGKISREVFEIRESFDQTHEHDFLTVGSMGHCSSIALGVALNKPDKKIWCIEGDGSGLMHMGAIPVIAYFHPSNLVHIVLNNGAHDTVGGMPTVMKDLSFCELACKCGYQRAVCVDDYNRLDDEIKTLAKENELSFIEIKCSVGARADLGRPTISSLRAKEEFAFYLQNLKE